MLDSEAVVWVKTPSGEAIRLVDEYRPRIFAEPRSPEAELMLVQMLEQSPLVRSVEAVEMLVGLRNRERRRLLRIESFGATSIDRVSKLVRRSGLVSEIYGGSLPHVHRYLFNRLRVEPSSRAAITASGERIVSAERLEDLEEIRPPPFTLLRMLPSYSSGRVEGLCFQMAGGSFLVRGSEDRLMDKMVELVSSLDPDLIYVPGLQRGPGSQIMDWLRSSEVRKGIGRCLDAWRLSQGSAAGRVFLGDVFYGFEPDEYGIAGLVERARFSFTTLGLATRWTSNRCIDSRNIYELVRINVLAPQLEHIEGVRRLKELLDSDRGGVTFTPKPGLHENVAALDFDSQYPSIILKHGISYESPSGGGQLIPSIIQPWLERRLRLKRLRKSLQPLSEEELYCTQRIEALKLILCTQYGISGCCWNRFGNTLAFEEINRISRQAMMLSKSVAEEDGFEIIYGDVDSLFVYRRRASRREYEELAKRISEATGLPMSLDRHFKFIAFPRLRTDPDTPALKRYFGLTYEGVVEARGIELRRSDTPPIVREFQERLIKTVLSFESVEEVLSDGVEEGVRLLEEYEGLIDSGLGVEELEIRRTLGRSPEEYSRGLAQAIAAIQLQALGMRVEKGSGVGFIYTSRSHSNPHVRVRASQLFKGRYDKEYYRAYLRRAAGTVFEAIGAVINRASKDDRLERWL
ncbi:MAG: DNA polymerase domain-containing protein [Nitrososphaerota archaeon]